MEKKDRKAVPCIRRWLDDSVFNKVSTETLEISLWKKLKSLYERKKAIFKVLLVLQLMNLTYEQGFLRVSILMKVQGFLSVFSATKIFFGDALDARFLESSLPSRRETMLDNFSNLALDGCHHGSFNK